MIYLINSDHILCFCREDTALPERVPLAGFAGMFETNLSSSLDDKNGQN